VTTETTVLGTVVERDRGSLPFAIIHGDALVACSSWALGEAEVQIVDATVPWAQVRAAGAPYVLHDALCPLTPPDFIARCVAALPAGGVAAGVRPVTDTVKMLDGDRVGPTVDRDRLTIVTSPLVLSAEACAAVEALPSTDFTVLLAWLRERFPTELVTAPPEGHRVSSLDDVRVLEALTAPDHSSAT
jgi:2-C-methyl-D-erythritol 4-phosphate cytidylyltransferase